MRLFRIGLPVLIAAVGIVLIVLGGMTIAALGGALLVIALLASITDALARLTISSQDDRDREEAARRYFSRTGHWPRRFPNR